MSLTSIIREQKEIREGLRARTERPSVRLGPIKAPSLTENYGLVGTAFDYLLRFRLQRINGFAQTTRWVAQQGVERIEASEDVYDIDDDALLSKVDRQRRKADKYLSEAEAEHRTYLKSGAVTDNLLVAVLRLAYLDVAYRVGPDQINWVGLKFPNPRDVLDLRALMALVDDKSFKASQVCMLNPNFGRASDLVGGADADLLIDDVLIDIKTTKAPRINPLDFEQLIGYYLLHMLDGIRCTDSAASQYEIKFLGIYFSRYGHLWKISVNDVFPPISIEETARWFFNSVCTSKTQRLKFAKHFRGILAKHLLPEVQKTPKSQKRRPASKGRRKLMSSRRSRADARKSGARR